MQAIEAQARRDHAQREIADIKAQLKQAAADLGLTEYELQ
jgi:hypothetical protein